jgi:hypothetical protein
MNISLVLYKENDDEDDVELDKIKLLNLNKIIKADSSSINSTKLVKFNKKYYSYLSIK